MVKGFHVYADYTDHIIYTCKNSRIDNLRERERERGREREREREQSIERVTRSKSYRAIQGTWCPKSVLFYNLLFFICILWAVHSIESDEPLQFVS